MTQIIVPDLGDAIEKVEIALWHKNVGDRVGLDEDLVELVTDKASFNVAAPTGGVLKKIVFPAGQQAGIGDILGEIE